MTVRPPVRPYVSPPLDVDVSRNEISHWRTHAYGLLEGKKKQQQKQSRVFSFPRFHPQPPGELRAP